MKRIKLVFGKNGLFFIHLYFPFFSKEMNLQERVFRFFKFLPPITLYLFVITFILVIFLDLKNSENFFVLSLSMLVMALSFFKISELYIFGGKNRVFDPNFFIWFLIAGLLVVGSSIINNESSSFATFGTSQNRVTSGLFLMLMIFFYYLIFSTIKTKEIFFRFKNIFRLVLITIFSLIFIYGTFSLVTYAEFARFLPIYFVGFLILFLYLLRKYDRNFWKLLLLCLLAVIPFFTLDFSLISKDIGFLNFQATLLVSTILFLGLSFFLVHKKYFKNMFKSSLFKFSKGKLLIDKDFLRHNWKNIIPYIIFDVAFIFLLVFCIHNLSLNQYNIFSPINNFLSSISFEFSTIENLGINKFLGGSEPLQYSSYINFWSYLFSSHGLLGVLGFSLLFIVFFANTLILFVKSMILKRDRLFFLTISFINLFIIVFSFFSIVPIVLFLILFIGFVLLVILTNSQHLQSFEEYSENLYKENIGEFKILGRVVGDKYSSFLRIFLVAILLLLFLFVLLILRDVILA